MLLIQLVAKQSKLLILLYQVLIYVVQMDLRSVNFVFLAFKGFTTFFQVCCQESKCLNVFAADAWVPSTISAKSGLTITLTVPSACVGKQLYGLRYLWRETPCPFKQAAIYSSTDANLPAGPYIKVF
jgi:sialate O-acetylesterase